MGESRFIFVVQASAKRTHSKHERNHKNDELDEPHPCVQIVWVRHFSLFTKFAELFLLLLRLYGVFQPPKFKNF